MDKHERPYRCDRPECSKLLGFTYSGGLLRHQREVHKMHGGTGKQLFCPETTCKRHTGSGFTRKENLQEHMRRVHRRTSTSISDGSAAATATRAVEDMERTPSAEREIRGVQQSVRDVLEPRLQAMSAGKMRADTMAEHGYANGDAVHDPAEETMRLRAEIESRDAQIESQARQLQEQGDRLLRLEQMIMSMSSGQGSKI